MKLPMLPADQANHALYGAAIFFATAWLAARNGLTGQALNLGLATTVAFALGKEALDRWLNRRALRRGQAPVHTVDGWDAAATVLPAAMLWLGLPTLLKG